MNRSPGAALESATPEPLGNQKALGGILLPEGQTVSHEVRNCLTAAFRDGGFRALDSDSETERAIPLEIRI